MEVRDGYMRDAPVLGRICGSGKGPLMRSTGSRLTVVYQPGPRPKPHKGFRAFYEGTMVTSLINSQEINLPRNKTNRKDDKNSKHRFGLLRASLSP